MVICWWRAPFWLQDWFIETMAEEGYEAKVTVEDLGFSGTTISALDLAGQGVSLRVGEIQASYGLGLITQGKVEKVQVREVNLELDLDLLLADEGKAEETPSLEDLLREWSNLPFEEALVEEVRVSVTYGGDRLVEVGNLLLKVDQNGDKIDLELREVFGRVALPEHQIDFVNLRIGKQTINPRAPWKQMEPVKLSFDELLYGGDEVALYEGSIELRLRGKNGPLNFALSKCSVLLPAYQVDFEGLAFAGEVLSLKDPGLSSPQSLRCDRLLLADEPVVEDLDMSFRVDANGTLLIDELKFVGDGVPMAFSPAEARVAFSEDGGATLELNGTTVDLPREGLRVEGVTGTVRLDSLDPLEIREPQRLSFTKASYDDVQWGPGVVEFALDRNGILSLTFCEGAFYEGILSMEPTTLNLLEDFDLNATLVLKNTENQELVNVVGGLKGYEEWRPMQLKISELAEVVKMARSHLGEAWPEGLEVKDG
ncbi:MAG: hypothetical protein VCA36_00035, partial [Opitutales bacterium]